VALDNLRERLSLLARQLQVWVLEHLQHDWEQNVAPLLKESSLALLYAKRDVLLSKEAKL